MKKRILFIEDDSDHAELVTEIILKNHNNDFEKEIILIKDGQEAIDYLQKVNIYGDDEIDPQIELVILDLNLPKVDGMEVLKFLKNNPRYYSVPVVVLSASSVRKVITEAYDNGADSFIVKPLSYERFVNVILAMEEYWLIKYTGSTCVL